METVSKKTNLPSLKKDDAHWQRLVSKVRAMTLMDDIFLNCFMEDDKKAMEYILNIIMERHDLNVINVLAQHCIPNIYGRGVRFDVFATDQYGTEYNFEVQNAYLNCNNKLDIFSQPLYDIHMVDSV